MRPLQLKQIVVGNILWSLPKSQTFNPKLQTKHPHPAKLGKGKSRASEKDVGDLGTEVGKMPATFPHCV